MRSDEPINRTPDDPAADAAPSDAASERDEARPAPPPEADEMGGEAPCQLHRWWDAEEDDEEA